MTGPLVSAPTWPPWPDPPAWPEHNDGEGGGGAAGASYYTRIRQRAGLHRYWRMGDAPGPFADESPNHIPLQPTGTGDIRTAPGLLPGDEDAAAEWFSGTPFAAAEANLAGLTNQWSVEWLFETETNNRPLLLWDWFNQDVWRVSIGTTGQVYFRGPSSTTDIRFTGHPVDDGQPHHAAVTCDGADARIYVDGQAGGTMALSDPLPTTTMIVGRAASSFAGTLDEIAVFNRALTGDEIAGDHKAFAGGR